MAKDVRVKHLIGGINKLMRSAPVQAEVNKAAARVAFRAGDKFQMNPGTHRWVARTFVEPKKGETLNHNDRIALLRALK